MTNQQLFEKVMEVFDGVVIEDEIEVYSVPGKKYRIE